MQTAGRAARNATGKVLFYADRVTKSMQKVIDETHRRRKIQEEYNQEHGITPKTIQKSVEEILAQTQAVQHREDDESEFLKITLTDLNVEQKAELISRLETQMFQAADALEFEKAARIRDEIERIRGGSLPVTD